MPLATIGLRPCVRILPSWSTSPTATLVPPMSTPRIGALGLSDFAHWLAAVMEGWPENCTLIVLISYGFVCTLTFASLASRIARIGSLHQIGFCRRFRSQQEVES